MFKTWDNKAESVEEKIITERQLIELLYSAVEKWFEFLEIDYFDIATEISLIVERLEAKIEIYGGINYHGLIVEKCD